MNQGFHIPQQPKQENINLISSFFSQSNLKELLVSHNGSKHLIKLIKLLQKEEDINQTLLKILPFIHIIIPNKYGKEILIAISSKLTVHQRLILWSKIPDHTYTLNHKSSYDSLSFLLSLIQSKHEEISIINYLKFKFADFSESKYGSLILKDILESFRDEANYILISYVYENFLPLIQSENGAQIAFTFLRISDQKPTMIKEGFFASISSIIPILLVSENGHKALLHIIKNWSIPVWKHLEKLILDNYFEYLINEFSHLVIEEIFVNVFNTEEKESFSKRLLKLNHKQIQLMIKRKGGYRSLVNLIVYLKPEDKSVLKKIASKMSLKQLKTYMKRYKKILDLLSE